MDDEAGAYIRSYSNRGIPMYHTYMQTGHSRYRSIHKKYRPLPLEETRSLTGGCLDLIF